MRLYIFSLNARNIPLKSVQRIDFFANFANEFTREVFQNGKLYCDKQKI